jgi:hypothetical protein
VAPTNETQSIGDKEIQRIAGADELTGDAIIEFAHRLLSDPLEQIAELRRQLDERGGVIELQRLRIAKLDAATVPATSKPVPEILRVLADWEDANGCLAAIMYDEWIALYKPITEAAVAQSPRMIRNAWNRRAAPQDDTAMTALKELVDCASLLERWGAISPVEPGCEKELLYEEYIRRNRAAWSRARSLVAARHSAGTDRLRSDEKESAESEAHQRLLHKARLKDSQ